MGNYSNYIEVISPGILTTIQDDGRHGHRYKGIPQSGCMDQIAYQYLINSLGQKSKYPILECTLKGPELKIMSDVQFMLAGADMQPLLNGQKIKNGIITQARKGDTLKLSFAKKGMRCYLAFDQMMMINEVLDSYSTYIPGEFGGYKGRALQKNDIISLQDCVGHQVVDTQYSFDHSDRPFTFIQGPEFDLLSKPEIEFLLSNAFVLNPRSNRQAIVLDPENEFIHNIPGIVSSATVLGTIQLLPSGTLAVLMNDGQTTGGYPRIGRLSVRDISRLAQTQPHQKVTFKLAD